MFKRAYEIAQDLGNPVVIEDARIQLGIASAHNVLRGFCSTMNNVNKINLQKILDFKSARLDAFVGEVNDQTSEEPSSRNEVLPDLDSPTEESGVVENGEATEPVETGESNLQPVSAEGEAEAAEGSENKETEDSGVTSEQEEEKKESS